MSLEFQPRTRGGPGSASGRSSCSRSTGGRTSFAVGRSAFYSGRWQGERQSYDTRLSCQHSVTSAPPTYRHNLAIPRHAALPRRALGNLPPDPGPGRPSPEGRAEARASSPSRTTERSPSTTSADGPSEGQRGQARLPLRAPPKAPVVRQYTVFNAEQADGLPARPTPTAEPLWKVHQNAERVLADSGVPVRHVAGDRAFYNLNRDEIVLPERVTVPLGQPLLPDRAPRAGAQHRPSRSG